jgi:hypothetical protein
MAEALLHLDILYRAGPNLRPSDPQAERLVEIHDFFRARIR